MRLSTAAALLAGGSTWSATTASAAAAGGGAAEAQIAKFSSLAAKNGGVIPLTSSLYDELVGSPSSREYTASVILTALNPKYGCVPCQQFDPLHKQVASQWLAKSKKSSAAQPNASKHFFAVLDFDVGQDVFRRLGLNTAPVGQLFLPTSPQPVQYDFARFGPSPEAFSSFVSQQTGLPITYTRPLDYSKLISVTTILVALLTGTYLFWNTVKLFLLSRWLWAVASLAFILPMISGYMWNQIRKPPYMQVTREGQASYIAGGYSNQYGVETQILSVIYGVLAFATYTITVTLPNLSHDKFRQRVGVYLWLGVTAVMASVLVSIFHVKNSGYPFRLLF